MATNDVITSDTLVVVRISSMVTGISSIVVGIILVLCILFCCVGCCTCCCCDSDYRGYRKVDQKYYVWLAFNLILIFT